MLTSGEGKYKIWLKKQKIGKDLIFFLGGGETPHIGSIVISEPKKKTTILKFNEHYDYIVLKPIAETASKKYQTKVVVIGGIHVDKASKEDINILKENCKSFVNII